jgi:hypothetical protein
MERLTGNAPIESEMSNEELATALGDVACRRAIAIAVAELEASGGKLGKLKILKNEVQAHHADASPEFYSSVAY